MDGKLNVLCQQVELPAIGALHHLAAEQKARAGHRAAGAQKHPGVVQVPGFPDKPQGIAGGNPVVPIVFGVAVAGDHFIAVGKGPVHLLHKPAVQHVVRVKDEKAVIDLGVILFNVQEQLLQGISLAHLFPVEPGIDHRALPPGNVRRGVGTVVGHDEHGEQTLVIGLVPYALDEIRNDRLLISGTNQNGEAVEDLWFMRLLLLGERYSQKKQLVGIAAGKDHRYDNVDRQDGIHFLTF